MAEPTQDVSQENFIQKANVGRGEGACRDNKETKTI